ncbi:MAG: DHH family phosphoesterase [Promethearchaeota archaeon]
MFSSQIQNLINFIEKKSILITTHDLIDLDGLISTILLKKLLERYSKARDIDLYYSEFLKNTLSFIKKITLEKKFLDINSLILKSKNLLDKEFDVLIIVDTNSLNQVKVLADKPLKLNEIPIIFIDHHFKSSSFEEDKLNNLHIIDNSKTSTVEIVLEICNYLNYPISNNFKELIIAAILSDTGFLKHANNETFFNLASLLNDDIDYQKIVAYLDNDLEISEKMARIKALQRVRMIRVSNWLIGVVQLSSFHASAANQLINLGFDVCLIYSNKKKDLRITARAKKHVCLSTGLHLGKLFNSVGGANGGGHDGAASLKVEKDIEFVLENIVESIKKILMKE